MAKGMAKGKVEGSAHRFVENVEALARNMQWKLQEACKALGITQEEYFDAKRIRGKQ